MEANVPTVSDQNWITANDRLLINKDGKVQQVSIGDLMDLFESVGFERETIA